MAKRVKRVKRTRRRSRLKSLKQSVEVGPSDGRNQIAIGDMDGAGPGDATGFTKRKKIGRKRGASGASEAGGSSAVDESEQALATENAVTRKGDGGFSGQNSDGFDRGREAYENYMRGNVEQDAERFAELRDGGTVDDFDPELTSSDAERLGQFKTAAHMVRMYDHWTLHKVPRGDAIERAATWLSGFSGVNSVRKLLTELESKPIRDIYPLEVMLQVLEKHPFKLPGVRHGSVIGGAAAFHDKKLYAGHSVQIPVPPDTRIKAFALLGGARPGYEFHPSKKEGYYTLLIDTPGDFEFALFAVRTQAIGKMTKELPGGVVEKLPLSVAEMGRKEQAPAAV